MGVDRSTLYFLSSSLAILWSVVSVVPRCNALHCYIEIYRIYESSGAQANFVLAFCLSVRTPQSLCNPWATLQGASLTFRKCWSNDFAIEDQTPRVNTSNPVFLYHRPGQISAGDWPCTAVELQTPFMQSHLAHLCQFHRAPWPARLWPGNCSPVGRKGRGLNSFYACICR